MRPLSSRQHTRESFLCKGFSFFVLATNNFICNKVPTYFCSSTLLCKELGLMLRREQDSKMSMATIVCKQSFYLIKERNITEA